MKGPWRRVPIAVLEEEKEATEPTSACLSYCPPPQSVAALTYSTMEGWYAFQYELLIAGGGLQLFHDAKQVTFRADGASVAGPANLLRSVLSGATDVGYLPAGALEAALAAGVVPRGSLRVLNPTSAAPSTLAYRADVSVSTPSYPESVFAALGSVNVTVRKAFAQAIFGVPASVANAAK